MLCTAQCHTDLQSCRWRSRADLLLLLQCCKLLPAFYLSERTHSALQGYQPFLLGCAPIQGSMRAKAKRHSKAAIGFCPDNEEACPIAGSNSLKQALIGAASGKGFLQYAAPTGGYECLDTQTSLESCGGVSLLKVFL